MAIKTCNKHKHPHIMHYRGIVHTEDHKHYHLWICGLCASSKTFKLSKEEIDFWKDTEINHNDFEKFLEHKNWYDAGEGIYFDATDASHPPMAYQELIDELYEEYRDTWKGA